MLTPLIAILSTGAAVKRMKQGFAVKVCSTSNEQVKAVRLRPAGSSSYQELGVVRT